MWELSKTFSFEAAHSLRRKRQAQSSARIHGHSYSVQITVRGLTDARSGMIIDLGLLGEKISTVHERLDHRLLDEIPDLGPATLENISAWIWRMLESQITGLYCVRVFRESLGDSCSYFGRERT